jgi:hypothetical protein
MKGVIFCGCFVDDGMLAFIGGQQVEIVVLWEG